MNRPFTIQTRKKGLKRWQEAGTLYPTKPGAERQATKIRGEFKDIGISTETKTRRMSVADHNDMLRYKKRIRR